MAQDECIKSRFDKPNPRHMVAIHMKWNDTNSTAGLTARYNLTGLNVNSKYVATNTTSYGSSIQVLTTDASGVLPSFIIQLNDNTEIQLQEDITPPS